MATRARAAHLKLNIDPHWLERLADKINPVLERAASGIEADAKAKAPYDEKSRRASGKRAKSDNFPTKHHRDTIYYGEVNETKRRGQAAEVGLFFNTMPGRLRSFFVRSSSGRGWWLEQGTTGLQGGMDASGSNYLKQIDAETTQKGRKRIAGLILRQMKEIAKGGKRHYSTPRQPHFSPAFKKWARYIKQKLQHIA